VDDEEWCVIWRAERNPLEPTSKLKQQQIKTDTSSTAGAGCNTDQAEKSALEKDLKLKTQRHIRLPVSKRQLLTTNV